MKRNIAISYLKEQGWRKHTKKEYYKIVKIGGFTYKFIWFDEYSILCMFGGYKFLKKIGEIKLCPIHDKRFKESLNKDLYLLIDKKYKL